MPTKRKPKELNIGDRVALVSPNSTMDGAEGVVSHILRIGGEKAPIHTYTVKLDDGRIRHPFPPGVRLVQTGGIK